MRLIDTVGLIIPIILTTTITLFPILAMVKAVRGNRSKNNLAKKHTKLSKARKTTALIGGLLLLIGSVHFLGWGLYGYFTVQPEWQREVHGHTVNAYYANTPDLMLEELQLARDGLKGFGLEGDEYSTLKPWHQTPDNRMDYQYSILDSVIERVEAVKEDRDRQERQGTSDQLGDVYETKMDNIREFIKEEGWLDDIGHGAYLIEEHPYYAWWANWGGYTAPIFLIGGLGVPALALFVGSKASGVIRVGLFDD